MHETLTLGVMTLAGCELAFRLPVLESISSFRRNIAQSWAVLRSSRISDTWKERVLPAYAGRMLALSFMFLGYLMLILAPLAIGGLLAFDSPRAFLAALADYRTVLAMMAAAIAFAVARTRLVRE